VAETTVAETTVAETTVAETTVAETTVAETTVAETTVAETTSAESLPLEVTDVHSTAPPTWLEEAADTLVTQSDVEVTRIDDHGKTVLHLVGRIPPIQLVHLARQNASLITTGNERVVVYRVGSRVHIGGVGVDKDSYSHGVYQSTGTPTKTVLPPTRRMGDAVRMDLQRKQAHQRR
jgi:hypothetical protein